jgi:HK97 family phage major capsid protein
MTTHDQAGRRLREIGRQLEILADSPTHLSPAQKRQSDELWAESKELKSFLEDRSRHTTRPPMDAIGDNSSSRTNTSGDRWVDQRTGREVRLLTPREPFAGSHPGDDDNELRGLTLGEFARAIVTGPKTDVERRALSTGVPADGGFLVPVMLSETVIDMLRAKTRCIEAGAKTFDMPTATFNMAKVASSTTPAFRAENALIPTSSPVFANLAFRARSFGTIVVCSRELIEDAGNLGDLLAQQFAKDMALLLDSACLYGSSTDVTQPCGIANTTGIGTIALNAAPSNYNPILDAVQKLAAANSESPTAAIMNPRTYREFNGLADTLTQPLRRPPSIENLSFLTTNTVSVSETVTAPPLSGTSSIFVGDFTSLLIGIRSQLRITTLVERYADYGQIAYCVFMRADVGLTHPAAFCRVTGVS